jgi:hypothetical protein
MNACACAFVCVGVCTCACLCSLTRKHACVCLKMYCSVVEGVCVCVEGDVGWTLYASSLLLIATPSRNMAYQFTPSNSLLQNNVIDNQVHVSSSLLLNLGKDVSWVCHSLQTAEGNKQFLCHLITLSNLVLSYNNT